jgi:hypothetical protein
MNVEDMTMGPIPRTNNAVEASQNGAKNGLGSKDEKSPAIFLQRRAVQMENSANAFLHEVKGRKNVSSRVSASTTNGGSRGGGFRSWNAQINANKRLVQKYKDSLGTSTTGQKYVVSTRKWNSSETDDHTASAVGLSDGHAKNPVPKDSRSLYDFIHEKLHSHVSGSRHTGDEELKLKEYLHTLQSTSKIAWFGQKKALAALKSIFRGANKNVKLPSHVVTCFKSLMTSVNHSSDVPVIDTVPIDDADDCVAAVTDGVADSAVVDEVDRHSCESVIYPAVRQLMLSYEKKFPSDYLSHVKREAGSNGSVFTKKSWEQARNGLAVEWPGYVRLWLQTYLCREFNDFTSLLTTPLAGVGGKRKVSKRVSGNEVKVTSIHSRKSTEDAPSMVSKKRKRHEEGTLSTRDVSHPTKKPSSSAKKTRLMKALPPALPSSPLPKLLTTCLKPR